MPRVHLHLWRGVQTARWWARVVFRAGVASPGFSLQRGSRRSLPSRLRPLLPSRLRLLLPLLSSRLQLLLLSASATAAALSLQQLLLLLLQLLLPCRLRLALPSRLQQLLSSRLRLLLLWGACRRRSSRRARGKVHRAHQMRRTRGHKPSASFEAFCPACESGRMTCPTGPGTYFL